MKYQIATILVVVALLLDTVSYWKQIKKILKTKKSSQVSSSSFLYKIAKEVIALIGLAIYVNWVGFAMGCYMLIVYFVTLAVIIKYKPKNWRLFNVKH